MTQSLPCLPPNPGWSGGQKQRGLSRPTPSATRCGKHCISSSTTAIKAARRRAFLRSRHHPTQAKRAAPPFDLITTALNRRSDRAGPMAESHISIQPGRNRAYLRRVDVFTAAITPCREAGCQVLCQELPAGPSLNSRGFRRETPAAWASELRLPIRAGSLTDRAHSLTTKRRGMGFSQPRCPGILWLLGFGGLVSGRRFNLPLKHQYPQIRLTAVKPKLPESCKQGLRARHLQRAKPKLIDGHFNPGGFALAFAPASRRRPCWRKTNLRPLRPREPRGTIGSP